MECHGGGELAEGLDLLDGDCARIHGNLVGEGLGDLVVGNATEQLTGLGHLGRDLDGDALDDALGFDGAFTGRHGLGQASALHGFRLGGGALGPCEREALRDQVVAGVAVLDLDDVACVAQIGDGLLENNLGISHFVSSSELSDRWSRTAAEPSHGRS